MRIGKIKADTPEPHPHFIPEVDKIPKSDIIVERTVTHKYNTRSSTKRVNHVKTFKNALNMFKMYAAEKINTHIGTDAFYRIDPKKETIIVEPIANYINFKNTGKILG